MIHDLSNDGLSSRDLELLDQVAHEPIAVGSRVEVVMIDAFDVDSDSLRLNLGDVLQSDIVRASLVFGSSEHRDGDDFDLAQIYHFSFKLALEPIIVKLLEPLHSAIHGPILL